MSYSPSNADGVVSEHGHNSLAKYVFRQGTASAVPHKRKKESGFSR
ncbi:MAG: hypothetical protein WAM58_14160 [Candidatus Acidiferrum sp.]